MKKILRLVTTSVLTLTLVACGEATQCPTCETCETEKFAEVSVIAISADTSSLTQVVGATKKVAVTAKFDGKADPATALEWYVNGAKQSQTGKTFEYTPGEAGSYKIVAKAGSVSSNELVVTVGTSVSLEAATPVVIDANSIQISAEAGAKVELSVAGKAIELKDESYYSLADGVYYLELAKDLAQGDEVKVVLNKDGKEVSKTVVYDTRSITAAVTLDGVTATVSEEDGYYHVTKPFYTDSLTTKAVVITVTSAGLENADVLQTRKATYSFPAGATAPTNVEEDVIVKSANSNTGFTGGLTINKDTVTGTYVYEYGIATKTVKVVVVVDEPEKTIAFNKEAVSAGTVNTTAGKTEVQLGTVSGLTFTADSVTMDDALLANADGSYTIEKPYLASVTNKAFQFKLNLANLDIREAAQKNGSLETNRVITTISGPEGTPIMRATKVNSAITPLSLRDTGTLVVTQNFDSTTKAGTYTYTFEVQENLDSGVVTTTKSIVIHIVEPEAKLTLSLDTTNSGTNYHQLNKVSETYYTIEKPTKDGNYAQKVEITAVAKNYESSSNGAAVAAAGAANTFTADSINRTVLAYNTKVSTPKKVTETKSQIGLVLDVENPSTNEAALFTGTIAKSVATAANITFTGSGNTNTAAIDDNAYAKIDDVLYQNLTGADITSASKTKDQAVALLTRVGSMKDVLTTANYYAVDRDNSPTNNKEEQLKALFVNDSSALDQHTFSKVFSLDVDFDTPSGEYTYEVQVGELTQKVTIKVVEPTQKLNFTVEDANSKQVQEITVTCASNTAGACAKTATLALDIANYVGAGTEDYSLEIVTPTKSEKFVDKQTVSATALIGNAVLTSTLLDKITTVSGGSSSTFNLANVGDYTIKLTLAGETREVVIHALPAPTVKVLSVFAGEEQYGVKSDSAGHEAYIYSAASGTNIKLTFNVEGVNLPAGKIYYTAAIGSDSAITAVELKNNKVEFTLTAPDASAVNTALSKVVIRLYGAADKTGGLLSNDAEITVKLQNIDIGNELS